MKKKRKLTQEKADAINRKRDLVEGTDRSLETQRTRVVVHDGRGTLPTV